MHFPHEQVQALIDVDINAVMPISVFFFLFFEAQISFLAEMSSVS